MYVILFLLALIGAVVLIDSGFLARTLGHPAGVGSYLKVVWLGSSVGIVAGALGSSLEDEETVRNATYSRRERERYERALRRREDPTSEDGSWLEQDPLSEE